jgi:hypothetical protein
LFCLQHKAVVVVDVAFGLLYSCCVTAQLSFDHQAMAVTRTITDEFAETWIIHQAFLEIQGPSRCNLLFLVADRTNTKHKVVFQNKFVNGNWRILSPADVQPPDAYQVSFHFDGNDAMARQFDYVRAIGTSAFVRSDGRVFMEPTDFDAMMNRYSPF